MKPIVVCIVPEPSFATALKFALEEIGADVYEAKDLTNGLVIVNRFGDEASVVIVDSFENYRALPVEPTSLDSIRKFRAIAVKARFFGMSAVGGEVCEKMVAEDLCHEAHVVEDVIPAVEAHLLSYKEN